VNILKIRNEEPPDDHECYQRHYDEIIRHCLNEKMKRICQNYAFCFQVNKQRQRSERIFSYVDNNSLIYKIVNSISSSSTVLLILPNIIILSLGLL
jgi:hypothetical protein